MNKTNLVRRRRTYEMNKRSYPMKLIVWTCNHIARCNGHISWMRDGRKWRRFCMRCLLINGHSNGLSVDFRDETNIDIKSSFGYLYLFRKRIYTCKYNKDIYTSSQWTLLLKLQNKNFTFLLFLCLPESFTDAVFKKINFSSTILKHIILCQRSKPLKTHY